MRPDPNKVAEAIHGWVSEEIKESTKRYHELGKFLFTVSSASGAFILSLKGVLDSNYRDFWSILALALLVCSFVCSIVIMKPLEWLLEKDSELEVQLKATIDRSVKLLYVWFAFWVAALVLALISIAPVAGRGDLQDLQPFSSSFLSLSHGVTPRSSASRSRRAPRSPSRGRSRSPSCRRRGARRRRRRRSC